MQEILLNVESKETRYAHLKNGQLHDLIIERKKERQLTGNIYKGRVTNILRNIQSAFIDISEGENGFIHISDIMENTKKFEEVYEMDFELDYDISSVDLRPRKNLHIEELLKTDHSVLVQVVKEPIGTKGARLTSNVSIAGRYLVLLPNTPHRGVSRKIEVGRDRLKRTIRGFEMPPNMGVICRTAAAEATAEMLADELKELVENWQMIMEKFRQSPGPALLYEESDLIKRAVMTAIDKKFDRLLVDDYNTYQRCRQLYNRYKTEHTLKLELYRDKAPIFERFNVEREIEKTLRRRIWLPSGGYLYFDKTEAMQTIDVNSGRSLSSEGGNDVEESLVRINLEAAEEIARQLRLRNIGGLIICDFIDMRFRKNQRRVLEKLKECMKEDSAKCTILGMSEFGLVEMTRQRSRNSLHQTFFTPCPYCSGSGLVKTHETTSIDIERSLKKIIRCHQQFGLRLVVHPELATHLAADRNHLLHVAETLNAHLQLEQDDTLHLNDFAFYSTINNKKLEV